MDDITLNSKFDAMVLPETGLEKRDKIADMIWNLEKLDNVAEFAQLMAR